MSFANPELKEFFTKPLKSSDPLVHAAINGEFVRQTDGIELIASENIVSHAVLEAMGSVLTNKYAEGYPGRRYYGGCMPCDEVETLAIERARELFGCRFVNVQPHSGSQANQAVFMALMQPGDSFLGLSLAEGGHLTHGSPANQSGKWFNSIGYGLDPATGYIDYESLSRLVLETQPKLVLAGGSAYSRVIDFARIRAACDQTGAKLMVDMAHFAGLVAGGAYPSPFPSAHVVTTTTHKTLRGARGGMILTNDEEISRKVNSAVFPGLQGGPLMHLIAGKAAAFGEALKPEFRDWAHRVVKNASILAELLMEKGYDIVSGGTDSHVMLVDLRSKGLKGNIATESLERVHITCNKNGVPGDTEGPTVTSGIRLGTPAVTTRGFGEHEIRETGDIIIKVLDALVHSSRVPAETERILRDRVLKLCARFPLYDFARG